MIAFAKRVGLPTALLSGFILAMTAAVAAPTRAAPQPTTPQPAAHAAPAPTAPAR